MSGTKGKTKSRKGGRKYGEKDTVFKKMARNGSTEKVTSEERPEGEGVIHAGIRGIRGRVSEV